MSYERPKAISSIHQRCTGDETDPMPLHVGDRCKNKHTATLSSVVCQPQWESSKFHRTLHFALGLCWANHFSSHCWFKKMILFFLTETLQVESALVLPVTPVSLKPLFLLIYLMMLVYLPVAVRFSHWTVLSVKQIKNVATRSFLEANTWSHNCEISTIGDCCVAIWFSFFFFWKETKRRRGHPIRWKHQTGFASMIWPFVSTV